MTRDSKLWWFVMGAGVLGVFSAHFDLLQACCDLGDKSKAVIELASLVLATAGGLMRASPINAISDRGRAKYMKHTVRLNR